MIMKARFSAAPVSLKEFHKFAKVQIEQRPKKTLPKYTKRGESEEVRGWELTAIVGNEGIEGSRTMRNRPYPVLKCSR